MPVLKCYLESQRQVMESLSNFDMELLHAYCLGFCLVCQISWYVHVNFAFSKIHNYHASFRLSEHDGICYVGIVIRISLFFIVNLSKRWILLGKKSPRKVLYRIMPVAKLPLEQSKGDHKTTFGQSQKWSFIKGIMIGENKISGPSYQLHG